MNNETISISFDTEYWTKTNNLRIYNGVLQQLIISSRGNTRWEDVQVIND